DEFVEIGNPRPQSLDVSGWTLTDGEGTARFPLDSILPAGGRLLVTRNATSYSEDTLEAADFTLGAGDARQMEGDVLRLADAGDEVVLVDSAGTVVDVYAWGDSSYVDAGWTGRVAEGMGWGEIAVRGRRVHVAERTDRLRPRGSGRTRRACADPAGRLARRRRRR